MSSPPRLRRSPARQALHERTESETNERGSPTLRFVEDPEDLTTDVGPYPTKPSQVLLPSGQHAQSSSKRKGESFEQIRFDSGSTYIQGSEPSKAENQIAYGQRRREEEVPYGSSTDISYYTGYGSQSTVYATPITEQGGSSSTLNPSDLQAGQNHWGLFSSEQVTERHDDSITAGTSEGRQPANKDSDNSLSSTNTTGTVIVKKKRASYSAFPYSTRPGSSKSNLSSPMSQKSDPGSPKGSPTAKASRSPIISSSPALPSQERRISSAPAVSGHDDSPATAAHLQYPVIRPPSASGSWAYSSSQPPPVPAKAAERGQQRWNPHLSTVPSEGTDSLSLTRSSGLGPNSTRASQSSSKLFGALPGPRQSSDQGSGSSEYQNLPKPSFVTSLMPSSPPDLSPPPPSRNRDFSGSTIRVVEGEDNNDRMKIPPTVPGSSDSVRPDIVGSQRPQPDPITRPSSTASFFRDSMPAWAKSYYNRPNSPAYFNDRSSVNAESAGINVWRPRTRDQHRPERPDRRRSGLAMHPTQPEDLIAASRRGFSRHLSPTPSAHLWRDRASAYQRRSLFLAPSIDEAAEGNAPTKRNIQVFSFALGFVIPFCWFIAAFLPLPPKPPPTSPTKGKHVRRGSDIAVYLEKQLSPTDLSRYENARWWRNINRLMCVVGATIIILIVSSCLNK